MNRIDKSLPVESKSPSWSEFIQYFQPRLASEIFVVHINWTLLLRFFKKIDLILIESELHSTHRKALRVGAANHLIERFCLFSDRIFIYELNIFSRNYSSEDKSKAYNDFLEACKTTAFLENKISKYSNLIRRLTTLGNQFCVYLEEHISHWDQDQYDIENTFGFGFNFDQLSSIHFGAGDSHGGSKTGIVYDFDRYQFYYKPRSLETDLFYNRILNLIAPDCGQVPTLSFENHGWQLGIRAENPTTIETARKFYHQAGMHLATLQLLGASDIHYENVLSAIDGTVYIVDTEALFSNSEIAEKAGPEITGRHFPTSAEVAIESWFRASPFKTGLISNSNKSMGQFSGLNTGIEAKAPIQKFRLVNQNNGDMSIQQTEDLIQIKSTLPLIENLTVTPADCRDDIVIGYSSTLENACINKDDLIALIEENLPEATRQVLRDTYIYQLFLVESTHPSIATDENSLEKFLSKMDRAFIFTPHLRHIQTEEKRQMDQMDIPIFHASPNSLALKNSSVEIYSKSAKRQVLDNLNNCCNSKRVRFEKLFKDLYPEKGESICIPNTVASVSKFAFDDIFANAIFGGNGETVSWLCRSSVDQGDDKIIAPINPSFYSGLAGILRFVSIYSLQSQCDSSVKLTNALINTLEHLLLHRSKELGSGLHAGISGIILSLSDAAVVTKNHALQIRVSNWAKDNISLLKENNSTDIISGYAGDILALLALYSRTNEVLFKELAVTLGDRLIENSKKTINGLVWIFPKTGKILLGFSHGVAGIAYAMICLWKTTHETRFLDVALLAISGEDEYFSLENSNWPDLRTDKKAFNFGWCNGIAGTVLPRLKLWSYLDKTQQAYTISALDILSTIEISPEDSLCHGTCGIIECFFQAERVLGRYGRHADKLLLNLIGSRKFQSGYSLDPQNLSLLIGLSGLGLTALRSQGLDSLSCPLLGWEFDH